MRLTPLVNRPPSATRRFWRSMPLRPYLLFLAAVFCLFSTFGFIDDIDSVGQSSVRELALNVMLSGLVAVAAAHAGAKSPKFWPLAVGLFAVSVARPTLDPPATVEPDETKLPSIERRMEVDAVGATVGVVLGYTCFVVFVATEGKRYLRVQTEMALAREIHKVLAPPIDRRLEQFEFFGASLPSSEVGGDLVDVVITNDRWVAYVADVSGHGVASGTLMAMFKGAARSQLMLVMDPQALLTNLNQVIFDLKQSNMFITCACLAYPGDHLLEFVLAGHLPILHYRHADKTIDELPSAHVPIGILERQNYRTVTVRFDPGDIFALATDGLTEVFDRHDTEFGIERLKNVVASHATRPLSEAFQAVVAEVRRHGPQTDDQSLLLVRCL